MPLYRLNANAGKKQGEAFLSVATARNVDQDRRTMEQEQSFHNHAKTA